MKKTKKDPKKLGIVSVVQSLNEVKNKKNE